MEDIPWPAGGEAWQRDRKEASSHSVKPPAVSPNAPSPPCPVSVNLRTAALNGNNSWQRAEAGASGKLLEWEPQVSWGLEVGVSREAPLQCFLPFARSLHCAGWVTESGHFWGELKAA